MTYPPNGYLRPSPWAAAQLADYNASLNTDPEGNSAIVEVAVPAEGEDA